MIVDFDDFHQANHRLDLLNELKGANPLFRCTLFAVPALGESEFWTAVPDWCELAVHGWEHGRPALDGGECRAWSSERMVELIAEIERQRDLGILWVRGFKAPGWQISRGCYEALLDSGWWVADQPYNDGRRPEGLRVHRIGDGDYWHGHIQNVCGNGLEETFADLVLRVRNASEFESISEAAQPWHWHERRRAREARRAQSPERTRAAALSIILPTIGRASLRQTLGSIQPQLEDDDEVIVVADADRAAPLAYEIFLDYGASDPRFVYAEAAHEEPPFGNAQRNHGMQLASGSHLAFIDDDDVYCEGALRAMREAACDRPVIFRMEYGSNRSYGRKGEQLWRVPELSYGNVGGITFLVPNKPSGLGVWKPWPESWNGECGADFSFITGCAEKMGPPVWREEVVAMVRPYEGRVDLAALPRRLRTLRCAVRSLVGSSR